MKGENRKKSCETRILLKRMIVMGDEPVPNRTPADVMAAYRQNPTEQSLADAFADASNESVWLLDEIYDHEKGSPDYYHAKALCEAWFTLHDTLKKRIFRILRSEGISIPKCGQIAVLEPFMARNGFRNGYGWWIEIDKEANIEI